MGTEEWLDSFVPILLSKPASGLRDDNHGTHGKGSKAEEVSRNVRKGAKNQKLSGLCGFANVA